MVIIEILNISTIIDKKTIEGLKEYIDFEKTFNVLNYGILKEDDKLFYHSKEVFEYYKDKYRKN